MRARRLAERPSGLARVYPTSPSANGGVRVPFVARWPGTMPANRTCTEPIISVDLDPTLPARRRMNHG